MENNEATAQQNYAKLAGEVPECEAIIAQEDEHEQVLIEMLDEERLQYVGSMVLGLNDALVELTGTLAGLTLALQKNAYYCPFRSNYRDFCYPINGVK
ncbi:MAG: hypothetical protein ACOYEK_03800 [bacterium]|jgi:VIT1/CCC1 family predicted Fe2+/Mn2+ transporter